MNKTQMIDVIANKANLSKSVAKIVLNSTLSAIIESLKSGEIVQLIGFGTFKINRRNACIGRNPQTGEEIKISAVNIPRFVSGKYFKNAIK
ncbi:HU family DNA-binding protein [Blochmannia endosymbiont of Polyrhachis (Hedomyrma) turneri]|uniref:HU family DNA-binding protein n=1 Tax=Blochmannia endosymbiont of Polyrhachis (Hedomyrma) turneri TaxID=1505596 RepID=UPI00061A53AB|nr:HU family DNA-binding protein [Blochmannia endosymbiont of Polyrhachis (Hedomyrma) turneri]AKC60113.1 DNA-binding protein HU-alpha [Blochmannia endosymbiont of Polyrhachis (Hedomyrma) turneri]